MFLVLKKSGGTVGSIQSDDLFFFSMMVKSVHNIHIQNHFGQVCIPKILLFFLF